MLTNKMVKTAVKLNSGYEMPLIGLGTFLSKQHETQQAVEQAIDIGYRHIDTAFLYFNEAEVGKAVNNKVNEGKIKREDMFIVTKLPKNHVQTPERVQLALEKSLKALDVGYIDLYLVHSPMGFRPDQGDHVIFPVDEKGDWLLHDADHIMIWKELEKAVKSGKVKSIGLSNFNRRQIQNILDNCEIKPANLQVECHLYHQQHQLVDFCHKNGITVAAYGPLGNPAYNAVLAAQIGKEPTSLLEEPLLQPLSKKYNKTPAQLLLRYLIQRDIIALPKSTNPQRLAENFDVFDFEFSTEEMDQLNKLDRKKRVYERHVTETTKTHKDYPFNDEY